MTLSYARRRAMYDEAGISREAWIVAEVARKTGLATRLCGWSISDPESILTRYGEAMAKRLADAYDEVIAEADAFVTQEDDR